MADLADIAARLRGSISDGWSGDAVAADADNAEEAATALIECSSEIVRLRAALRPFALNPGAISLSAALGHITREDLIRAKAAYQQRTITK